MGKRNNGLPKFTPTLIEKTSDLPYVESLDEEAVVREMADDLVQVITNHERRLEAAGHADKAPYLRHRALAKAFGY